jgi:hypothetical protein
MEKAESRSQNSEIINRISILKIICYKKFHLDVLDIKKSLDK